MAASKKASIYKKLPFYYGWIIFLITLTIYVVVYGLRYSFGVFFTPLREEFGWTAAMTAGAMTLHIWIYGLCAPFMGRLSDRFGSRKIVTLGGFLLGFGTILLPLTYEIWHIYVFYGIVAAAGEAALYVVPTMILARFFVKKRGKVIGWASIGISLGQALLVPFAAWSTTNYGWRFSYIVFGTIVFLVISVLGYITMRDSPESIGLKVNGDRNEQLTKVMQQDETTNREMDWTPRRAISTKSFRLTAISYFFMFGAFTSVLTFLIPHIIWLGIDPVQAASAFSYIGLMSGVGSFVFGFISDRIDRKYTIIVAEIGLMLMFFLATLIPADMVLLYIWAAAYGFTYGGTPEQYAALITDNFGRKYNTTIFGLLTFGGSIGGGLFPLIGGYLVDLMGNYYGTLIFLAIGVSVAAASIIVLKPPEYPNTLSDANTNSIRDKVMRNES